MTGTLRICKKGHRYYKSSDCPVCPSCAIEDKKKNGFIPGLAAPALRALAGAGIKTISELKKIRETDLSALHGMGPSALKKIKEAMKAAGVSFKKD